MSNVDMVAAEGLAKKVYDKSGVANALPATAIIQDRVKFSGNAKRIGDAYVFSQLLRPPNGFTYPGSSGLVVTLKDPRAMVIRQGSVKAFELDLVEHFSYAALSRLQEEGDASFGDVVGTAFMAMKMQAANREETQILGGQRPLGVVEEVEDLTGGKARIRITAATWSPGLWWAIGQQATLDAFTATTKNNSTGPLVTYDLNSETRDIFVDFSGTLASEVAANDTLVFEGAWTGTVWNEMPGIIPQASTVSGISPTGIDLNQFPNARGNVVNVAGPMSFGVFEQGCRRLRERNAEGKLSAYVPPIIYSELIEELKVLRVLDSSYSPDKGSVGHQAVDFSTPKFGRVELVEHPFLRNSEFLVLREKDIMRVGSSDIEFGIPGKAKDKSTLFHDLPGTNGAALKLFADLGCGLRMPGMTFYANGITH